MGAKLKGKLESQLRLSEHHIKDPKAEDFHEGDIVFYIRNGGSENSRPRYGRVLDPEQARKEMRNTGKSTLVNLSKENPSLFLHARWADSLDEILEGRGYTNVLGLPISSHLTLGRICGLQCAECDKPLPLTELDYLCEECRR